MTLLAIDIGNSSISLGIFDFDSDSCRLIDNFKLTTLDCSVDEYEMKIRTILRYKEINNIDDCAISSVVPKLTPIISSVCKRLSGLNPFVVNTGIKTGFDIHIKKPEQLGADLVANAAFAIHNYPAPSVILDVGTATTLSVIGLNSEFLGTIIAPGIKVSFTALSGSTSQLTEIPFDSREYELIGRTTEESVRSGILNGQALMIDGMVRNIRETLNTKEKDIKLTLLATGGLAEVILPRLRNKFTYCENMTLEGIIRLYKINHK